MVQVARLAHAAFTTPDVDSLTAYYTGVIGLTLVERTGDGAAYLSSTADHHQLILSPAAESRVSHIAFQLDNSLSLEEAAGQLRDHGIKVETQSDPQPTIAKLLQFSDPEGYVLQMYTSSEQRPTKGADEGIGRPIRPKKLGHIALRAQNVQIMAEFYETMLGFRVSDWMGDFFVFLRCGPDHHTMNFLQSPRHSLQHIAFELEDWDSIKRACDHLGKHRIELLWGPGRHGIGHNIFTYHHNPDHDVVELFTEIDIMNEAEGYFEPRPWHDDSPQRPKVWQPSPRAANHWGIAPPPELMQ